MKRAIAALAAAPLLTLGLAAPAAADTIALPYGGTATLTIPDITLPANGCVDLYGTFSTTHVDSWSADIDYSGPTTFPVGDFVYGFGPGSQVTDFYLCAGSDMPGLYTATALVDVEDPNSFNTQQAFVTDQFTVTHAAPPAPPAPVYSNVSGSVSKTKIARGVRFKFRTSAIPAGTLAAAPVSWKVKYDGRSKTLRQGPAETDRMTVRFASGTHVVKVYRNGVRVLSHTVRAG